MQPDRIVAAAALALACGAVQAYQIVEGRYRVETAPGVFQDQLVVRCDDARTITVPWETRLAEACGESLMGGPAPKAAKAAADEPLHKPAAEAATLSPLSSLVDAQGQKEAMLAQVREQFGNVPERHIEFKPSADGLSMRFLPPLSDILKKYEICRKLREQRADCAAERDRGLAKLTDAAPLAAVAKADQPTTAAKAQPQPAVDAPTRAVKSSEPNALPAQPEPAKQASEPAAASPDRAAVEQRIREDYSLCMRAKPKFECEQARARASSELGKPKTQKPKRPAKQASTQPQLATTTAQ